MIVQVTETQGPRGAQGPPGPQGPKGNDANVPTNVSAFVNDPPYITPSSANTLTNKAWQGTPIADAYIASSSLWNSKQNALGYSPENIANRGVANGYCPLGSDTKISSLYLPAYVDDVVEYNNKASFPSPGSAGIVYVALDTGKQYRWSGSTYIELSPSPGSTDAVPEGSVNLYYTTQRVQSVLNNYPITVFNNNAGYLTLGTLPTYPTIPTNVSAFTNDAGYYNANTLPQIAQKGSIGVNIYNFGSVLQPGQQGFVRVPYNATIEGWSMGTDGSVGNAVVDIWKRSGNLPDVTYTICGNNKPQMTAASQGYSNILTNWITNLQALDWIGWNLDSASTITRLIFQLLIKT